MRCYYQPDDNPYNLAVNPAPIQFTATHNEHHRLTDVQIQELEVFTYSTNKHQMIATECTICLGDFEENDMCTHLPSPCGHAYHKECIDKWFQKSSKCPLCGRYIALILAQSNENRERNPELGYIVDPPASNATDVEAVQMRL